MGFAMAPGKAMPRVPLRPGEGNKDQPFRGSSGSVGACRDIAIQGRAHHQS